MVPGWALEAADTVTPPPFDEGIRACLHIQAGHTHIYPLSCPRLLSLANLSCSPCFILTQESGRVLVANVGDSQAFLLRKGQALGLSTPHRVYGSGKGGDEGKSETARGSEASGFLASLWLRDAEREREREGESSSPPRPGLRLQSI